MSLFGREVTFSSYFFSLYICLSFFSYSSRHLPLKLNCKGRTGFSLSRSQIATANLFISNCYFLSSLASWVTLFSIKLSDFYIIKCFFIKLCLLTSLSPTNLKIFMKLSTIEYNFRHLLIIFSKCTRLGILPSFVNWWKVNFNFSK